MQEPGCDPSLQRLAAKLTNAQLRILLAMMGAQGAIGAAMSSALESRTREGRDAELRGRRVDGL